jgi:hypothetical protein
MLPNISNELSPNMFEASTGVLNFAPIKISGQYKIVIDINQQLWLDDYNNRRVAVNLGADFLPQAAAFLRTPTVLKDNSNTAYGGYNPAAHKTWHVPLYLGSDGALPTHFVVSQAVNQAITDPSVLQNYSSIISLVDLKQCGVFGILQQIQEQAINDYPVQMDWDGGVATIYGFSIQKAAFVQQAITLLDSQSNQPYYAVLNNMFLNSFKNNGIFFPKFVNIEMEFDYVNDKVHFNNFYGYLTTAKPIQLSDYSQSFVTARVKEYPQRIEWEQQLSGTQQLAQYQLVQGSTTIIALDAQPAQIRILAKRIQAGDVLTVKHPDTSTYFTYTVLPADIRPTLLATLKQLCIKLTTVSNRFLVFTCDVNDVITVSANIDDDLIEGYTVMLPPSMSYEDGRSNFMQITNKDLALSSALDVATALTWSDLIINGIDYVLVTAFSFAGQTIVRLNKQPVITKYTTAQIFSTVTEDLLQLRPLPWFTYNSDLAAVPQYDIGAYCAELTKKFVTDSVQDQELKDASTAAITDFLAENTAIDVTPYVSMDGNGNFNSEDHVTYDATPNDNGVLLMSFNTPGSTSFVTPNTFNMDMQFWDKNGNPDPKLLKLDPLRFHWFLIKGEAPAYVSQDVRRFRYFTDAPAIGSRLIANGALYSGEAYCETVFLGVRYQLPQKYSGYLFSVYLDPNDDTHQSVAYNFEIDDANRLLRLRIAKYLDFSDLMRGSDSGNTAFLDVGALYSVKESYNTKSTNIAGFQPGGLMLGDKTIQTVFNSTLTTDMKIQDTDGTWYICLKRSSAVVTQPLDEMFLPAGNGKFSIFSKVTVDGTVYEYMSVDFTIVGIHQIAPNYLWCRDLQVQFFDTPSIFINQWSLDPVEIFPVDKSTILSSVPVSGNVYGDDNIIATILVDGSNQQFRLLNHDKVFSFIEDWFELSRVITYALDTAIPGQLVDTDFYFPGGLYNGWTLDQIKAQFLESSFDSMTPKQLITLFDRNQIWHMLRDVMLTDTVFKESTSKQIINNLAQLLVSQLQDSANLGSLPATGGSGSQADKFINMTVVGTDVNLAIWKTGPAGALTPKLHALNRFHGPYLPYLRKLDNELQFQSEVSTKPQSSILNIWDPNFGGLGVSATGLWAEVEGNVVSSLFCMDKTLVVTEAFGTQFDMRQLLGTLITIDEAIIVNDNAAYISRINANVDQYIVSSYIDWLLLNMYGLGTVTNELGQKVAFTVSTTNAYIINFQPANTYQTRFNMLVFNFIRK